MTPAAARRKSRGGASLSPREVECLRLVSEGWSYAETAAQLAPPGTEKGVEKLLWNARTKLGARSTTHADKLAVRRRLIARNSARESASHPLTFAGRCA